MDRTFFVIGCAGAFLGVAAGAFGAHALRNRLSSDMLSVFETGVRYQMYVALALLAVSWAAVHFGSGLIGVGGWLLTAGAVIFSGSLYILALTGIGWLGAITPLGGLALLAGFGCLLVGALQS